MTRPLPALEGVEHRFVKAAGLEMHVADAGAGAPVLLLHGWPQHWGMWSDVIGPLAEEGRVIAPDLRGFGWTAAPPGGYDPEVFALDLLAMLDALGIEEPVDVAGHDWGGWTAFVLALRHPERVRSVLAAAIPHPFVRPTPRGMLGVWRLAYQPLLAAPGLGPAVVRSIASRRPRVLFSGADRPWSGPELESYAAALREPARTEATSLLYRHALTGLAARRRQYRRMVLRQKALLLMPADDAVLKGIDLRGYERNAPNLEIERVPGASHFIVDEKPELIVARARRLFRGRAAAQSVSQKASRSAA